MNIKHLFFISALFFTTHAVSAEAHTQQAIEKVFENFDQKMMTEVVQSIAADKDEIKLSELGTWLGITLGASTLYVFVTTLFDSSDEDFAGDCIWIGSKSGMRGETRGKKQR